MVEAYFWVNLGAAALNSPVCWNKSVLHSPQLETWSFTALNWYNRKRFDKESTFGQVFFSCNVYSIEQSFLFIYFSLINMFHSPRSLRGFCAKVSHSLKRAEKTPITPLISRNVCEKSRLYRRRGVKGKRVTANRWLNIHGVCGYGLQIHTRFCLRHLLQGVTCPITDGISGTFCSCYWTVNARSVLIILYFRQILLWRLIGNESFHFLGRPALYTAIYFRLFKSFWLRRGKTRVQIGWPVKFVTVVLMWYFANCAHCELQCSTVLLPMTIGRKARHAVHKQKA